MTRTTKKNTTKPRPAWAKKLEVAGVKLSDRDFAYVVRLRGKIRAQDRYSRLNRIAELSFGPRYKSEDSVLQPPVVRMQKGRASRVSRRS